MTVPFSHDNDVDHQPLLSSPTEPLVESIDTPSNAADDEAEEETIWLAHLQRMPWYKRPSVVWMMPMLLILSTAVGALGSPKQQLAIRIICKDFYASGQHIELALEDDRCQQPAVLAAAALLHSRVGAIEGILSKSSFSGFHPVMILILRKIPHLMHRESYITGILLQTCSRLAPGLL